MSIQDESIPAFTLICNRCGKIMNPLDQSGLKQTVLPTGGTIETEEGNQIEYTGVLFWCDECGNSDHLTL